MLHGVAEFITGRGIIIMGGQLAKFIEDYYVMTQKPWSFLGGGIANHQAQEPEILFLGTRGMWAGTDCQIC